MPRAAKPEAEKRVQKGVTLLPEHAARLAKEAEERDLSESRLISKGLTLLFLKFDADASSEG